MLLFMTKRPGFFFCICPDSALLKQYIQGQLQSQTDNWQQKIFWADEEIPDTYWKNLTLSSLIEQPKAVVLRKAEKNTNQVWGKLSSVLDRFRPNIWPFFCLENEWSRGKPALPSGLTKQRYWQIARKKGWIWQSPGLSKSEIKELLEKWAKNKDVFIPPDVFQSICQLLPLNASVVQNELKKLELLAADTKQLDMEDLRVISFQGEMDIFQFLRALESPGREADIWRQIFRSQMASQTEMLMPFLALMLREARLMWQLISGEDQKVKMPPSVKQDKKRLAQRLGKKNLIPIWTLILEAETGLKSGERTPEQAFEMLMSGLMEIFNPQSSKAPNQAF